MSTLKSQRTLRASDEAQTFAAELQAAHDQRIAQHRSELAPLFEQLSHCRLDDLQKAHLGRLLADYFEMFWFDDVHTAAARIRTFLRARLLDPRSRPEIPADESAAIIKALRAHGVTPTAGAILALFLEGKMMDIFDAHPRVFDKPEQPPEATVRVLVGVEQPREQPPEKTVRVLVGVEEPRSTAKRRRPRGAK